MTHNYLYANGTSLHFGASPIGGAVDAHFNRIISPTTAYNNVAARTVNLANNWWGCNTGPNNFGCGAVIGTANTDPWLVLGVSASPTSIPPFGNSTITADMTKNSFAADTTGLGTLAPLPVAWSATNGFMIPPSGTITSGMASSTFTSNGVSSGSGCATVDNQLTCATVTVAAVGNAYTWNGTVSTDWQIPLNWTPARVPGVTDVLTVDGSLTPAPIITNVPTQTIASLRLINSASVTLNAQALATRTLTVSGGTSMDLAVGSGSLLRLAGTDALKINIASGSHASVSGQVIFQDGPHRIIGNAALAAHFHFGSICTTTTGFTGNPFGTGGPGDGLADSVVFETGSKYFHNAGLSPFGTAGLASVATFQSGNEAHWLTSSGFQASDRIYADLIIGNSSTATSVSDTGTGNFQFQNLIVNSTPTTSSSISYDGSAGTGRIIMQGNITSNGVGSGSLPDVIFKAGTQGIVMDKQFGTITFGNDGSNSRGIDFESSGNVEFDTTLALQRRLLMGIVQPNSSVLRIDGALTGGSSGYVIGKVRRPFVATGSFNFHVGTVNGYSPVAATVTSVSGLGPALTVSARDGSQPVLTAATSLQRYWTLTEGGDITADLTFNYLPGDVNGNEANYRLVVVESGNATSFPEVCPAGPCVDESANTIKQVGVQDFSDWTAAEPAAPTAVKLVDFSAVQTGNEVTLSWQTGYETRNLGYNVYREQGGRRVAITPSLVAGSACWREAIRNCRLD